MGENKKQKIAAIVLTAFFIRVILALLCVNEQAYDDTFTYIMPWMRHFSENGIMEMYAPVVPGANWGVDYPPLYYPLMYFTTGWLAVKANAAGLIRISYFLLRLFPILLDTIFVYMLAVRSKKVAWLWALAAPAIIDMSFMGQSDALLVFEAFLMFVAFHEKKSPVLISLIYAVMATTKLQGLYFLPIFIAMLWMLDCPVAKKAKGFLCGVFAGFIIWLPWLLKEGVPIFFRIYLGSYDKTKIIAANASNFYILSGCGLLGNNLPDMMYNILGPVLLLMCSLIFILILKNTHNIEFASFVYLLSIYMITLQQRERYEMYAFGVMVFAAIWSDVFKSVFFKISVGAGLPMLMVVLYGGILRGTNAYVLAVCTIIAFLENVFAITKLPGIYKKLKTNYKKEGDMVCSTEDNL